MLRKIIELLRELMSNKWTGQIVINFHKGDISSKVERKDVIVIE